MNRMLIVENPKTWGDYARNCRARKGLTQKELAKLSGIPKNTIGNFETDKHTPNLMTLLCLSKVLGVGLDEYIGNNMEE